jgi:hypothetical protein
MPLGDGNGDAGPHFVADIREMRVLVLVRP